MLSARQQHCLRGIGICSWRERLPGDEIEIGIEASPAVLQKAESPALEGIAQGQDAAAGPGGASLPMTKADSVSGPAPASETEQRKATESQPAPPPQERKEPPKLEGWDDIITAIQACEACELSQNCTQKVPGVGDRRADLMIVGEGPGHDEDIRGEPFVGRSGQLLDRMLAAIGIEREQVYITNIVKCRPPNNRDPKAEEAHQCRMYLEAQIRQVEPRVILAVGRVSAHNLLDSNLPVGKLIRDMHRLPGTDIPLKVTYHPAYLLRNPSAKSIAWQDMKLLHGLLQ